MAKIWGQLERAQFENLSSDPTGAGLVKGRIWINTTSNVIKFYDGTTVQSLDNLFTNADDIAAAMTSTGTTSIAGTMTTANANTIGGKITTAADTIAGQVTATGANAIATAITSVGADAIAADITATGANAIATAITSTGADAIASDVTATGANAIASAITSISSTAADAIGSAMTSIGANAVALDVMATGANSIANVRTRTVTTNGTDPGIGGMVFGGTASGGTTATTSWVQPPGFSLVLSTSGRPVMLTMAPYGGSGSEANFGGTSNNGYVFSAYRFKRNGTLISEGSVAGSAATLSGFHSLGVPSAAINFIDVVAAGTYTYVFEMIGSANCTTNLNYTKFLAYEL